MPGANVRYIGSGPIWNPLFSTNDPEHSDANQESQVKNYAKPEPTSTQLRYINTGTL